jgi:hypothetical protein
MASSSTTTLLAQMQLFDPGAEPDWRYQRILEIIHRHPSPGRCSRYDDKWVKRSRGFILAYEQKAQKKFTKRQLMLANPELYYAYLIHERAATGTDADVNVMLLIQARIISGQSNEDIAKLVGTHPGVIEWYARLFFDVRDRLHQRDWIITRVLVPALVRSPLEAEDDGPVNAVEIFSRNFLDGSLKYFGYFGGGEVINTILGGQRREVSENATDEFLDTFFRRQLKVKTIQAISRLPVNRYNINTLLETYMELVKLERAAGGTAEESAYSDAMTALLSNVNFKIGGEAKKMIEQTPLGNYYDKDYDLSFAEQQALLNGGTLNIQDEDMQNPLLTRESTQVKETLADVKTTNAE